MVTAPSFHAFTAWLRQQPTDSEVGWATDAEDCPLARFFLAQGYSRVSVTPDSILLSAGGASLELQTPAWASLFITGADRLTAYGEARICAGRALELLAQVESLGSDVSSAAAA